jgi:hypothetical protein
VSAITELGVRQRLSRRLVGAYSEGSCKDLCIASMTLMSLCRLSRREVASETALGVTEHECVVEVKKYADNSSSTKRHQEHDAETLIHHTQLLAWLQASWSAKRNPSFQLHWKRAARLGGLAPDDSLSLNATSSSHSVLCSS